MKKLIIASASVLILLAGVASAQTYYPISSGSCSSISGYLSIGSSGSQVRALQRFLVAQNYPGGGSWMETGTYGQATAAAVRNFQQTHNLPRTGAVDAATLSAINGASCTGAPAQTTPLYTSQSNPFTSSFYPFNTNPFTTSFGNSYPSYPTYQNNYQTYPYLYPQNQYRYNPYPFNYHTYVTPTITSLSQNTGVPGDVVTVYGQGFDPWNNTVSIGGSTLPGVSSANGTSLTFTIPFNIGYYGNGAQQLSISNARGTSNSVSFTINPFGGCGSYGPYSNCGGCGNYGYPYNGNCGGCQGYPYSYGNCGGCNGYGSCANAPISITSIDPQQGGVGSIVTIYGTGFSTTGNTVHFGNGIIAGLNSADGRAVSFVIPSQLTGYGSQPVVVGTYNVSVANALGAQSGAVPFTVTSTGTSGTPSITSVTGPTSLNTNQSGSWSVTFNNPGSSYVTVAASWGDTGNGYVNMAAPQTIYGTGSQTATFTHAYNNAGTYTIQFTVANQYGSSNSYTSTVYVAGSNTNGNISLSSISPTSGHIGTQVILTGSGFTNDNTVHFGIGGTLHLPSYNGTTIYYTIPASVSACDLIGYGCAAPSQVVLPGTYSMYVTNQNGTSQSVTFSVN